MFNVFSFFFLCLSVGCLFLSFFFSRRKLYFRLREAFSVLSFNRVKGQEFGPANFKLKMMNIGGGYHTKTSIDSRVFYPINLVKE